MVVHPKTGHLYVTVLHWNDQGGLLGAHLALVKMNLQGQLDQDFGSDG